MAGCSLRTLAHPSLPDHQSTVIVERWWKVPLAGEGRKPHLHRRHRVYKLVEDTKHRPKDNLELILTQSVDGKAWAQVLTPSPVPVLCPLLLFDVNRFLPLFCCFVFTTLWFW